MVADLVELVEVEVAVSHSTRLERAIRQDTRPLYCPLEVVVVKEVEVVEEEEVEEVMAEVAEVDLVVEVAGVEHQCTFLPERNTPEDTLR